MTRARRSRRSGSSRRSHTSGSPSRSSVTPNVSAPSRISPPPRGRKTATSTRVENRARRSWRGSAGRSAAAPISRLLKRPSGKRAAIERTRSSVEMRAGQTRSSGVAISSGTSQASPTPSGRVTSADQRVERQAGRGDGVRVLGRLPSARLRGEADDRWTDAEIEHGQVDRDRADERPDAERLVSDRVERDRRDDEARDDRRRVDARRSRGRFA